MQIVSIEETDILDVKKDTKTHFADALHIVLAKKSGADILLTSNIRDFSHFSRSRTYDTI